MSSIDHANFFTELARLEGAYDEAKARLRGKGQTSLEDGEEYRRVATELAEWRRDIKILAGRPMVVDAPTGAE